MPTLNVPGADIHYDTVGSGPLLLCISGANGSKETWLPLGQHLQTSFTVAYYDRRGFSRSYLSATEAQDYSKRLATDADDAAALIKHLSPNEPATVIGSSSGAIVSLELLARHPDVIRILMPHEPPALHLLSDVETWTSKQQKIYDIYRAEGVPPAIAYFSEVIRADDEGKGLAMAFNPQFGPFVSSNTLYWFERELMHYPFREFDQDVKEGGSLQKNAKKLLLLNGELSNKEAPQYLANPSLNDKLQLGQDVVHLPGAHLGYLTHAAEFAPELLKALKAKDSFYSKL